MKNLFAVDEKTQTQYSERFNLRTADDEENDKETEVLTEIWEANRRAMLPPWLLVVSFVCIMVGMIMILFLTSAETDEEMKTAITVASIGAGLSVVGLILLSINALRLHKLKTSPYYQSLLEKKKVAEKLSYERLGVPESADEITLLLSYKEAKNPQFFSQKVKIFSENGNLCLANTCEVIGVPLRLFTAVYTVNAKTRFSDFDEETRLKPAEAKRLGLKVNAKNGEYIAPYRYSARFMHGAEEFEIVFPPYEIEKFKKYSNAPVIK